MNNLSGVLKQLFVVGLWLVSGVSNAVEVDDFFSSIPGVQQEAITHASDLAAEGRYQLHTRLVMERNFPGRNAVILALLNLDDRVRTDLVSKLLLSEVPREASLPMIAALKNTFATSRLVVLLSKAIEGNDSTKARSAAYSLTLLALAKPNSEIGKRLVASLSKVSDDFARSIFHDMFHWDVVPPPELLKPLLESFSGPSRHGETRAEVAMLRIKLLEDHVGAANILKAALQKAGGRSAHGVAKALLSTPKLSAEDQALIETLQFHSENLTMMGAALAWREIRQSLVDPSFDAASTQWRRTFSLFDDYDMDEASAEVLLVDLVNFLKERRALWEFLNTAHVTQQIAGPRGHAMLERLNTLLRTQPCPASVASDLSSPLPEKFLQAILL